VSSPSTPMKDDFFGDDATFGNSGFGAGVGFVADESFAGAFGELGDPEPAAAPEEEAAVGSLLY